MTNSEINTKELISKIDKLENKIDNLTNMINNNVNPSCQKMNNHINFIEKVYGNIRYPLSYLCNKINFIMVRDKTNYNNLLDTNINNTNIHSIDCVD